MKRLILSMATMLLTCIGASAQSNETLKGDVNGDGRVDITDVTATIDLILSGQTYGYFYFGTTEPTASNYQSLPGVVATYTSLDEAAGATVSTADGETLYLLCPAAWLTGKAMELEDNLGNSIDFSDAKDDVTLSGYVIYKTSVLNGEKIVGLKTPSTQYYWYVGQTDPSTMNSISPIVENNSSLPGWRYIGSSLPTYSSSNRLWSYTTGDINIGSLGNIYIAIPNTTSVPRDGFGGNEVDQGSYEKLSNTKTINGVTYTIYKSTSQWLMSFTEDIY